MSEPKRQKRNESQFQEMIFSSSSSLVVDLLKQESKIVAILQCQKSHGSRIKQYIHESCQNKETYKNVHLLNTSRIKNIELFYYDYQTSLTEMDFSIFSENKHLQRVALNQILIVTTVASSIAQISAKLEKFSLSSSCKVVFRIHAFPTSLAAKLFKNIDSHIELSPTKYTHILSVIELNEDVYLIGIVPAVILKDWCRENSLEISKSVPRAYFKLQEAMERFFKTKDKINECLNGKLALDCGAAPGGWTQYLIEHKCAKVTSIDPGSLYPSILNLSNVSHMPMKIQDAIPLLMKNSQEKFNIVVSDMCLHEMMDQIKLLLKIKPLLASNSLFVLTLKCVAGYSEASFDAQVQRAQRQLGENDVFNVKIMHLFGNRSRERTIMGFIK